MSAGITRLNGKAETGESLNVTGRKSTFIGGYQPLFVTIKAVSATYPFATSFDAVNSKFEHLIRACETVGTVVGYGTPAIESSSATVVVMFDAGSVNQGDGTGGQNGATTGFAALKAAIVGAAGGDSVTITASDLAVTTYTGFTGTVLA